MTKLKQLWYSLSILLLLPPISLGKEDSTHEVPWKQELELARGASDKNDDASAETHYQRALSGMNAATAHQRAMTAQDLGMVKYRLQKYAEAVKLFESCTSEFEKVADKEPDAFSYNLEMLSRTYRHLGMADESLSTGIRALKFAAQKYGKGSEAYGLASRNLGKLYVAMNRPADAEAAFRQSIKIFESSSKLKESEILGGCLLFLLESVKMQGKSKEAEIPPIKARIRALEKKLGKTL